MGSGSRVSVQTAERKSRSAKTLRTQMPRSAPPSAACAPRASEHVRASGEPGRPARRGPWEGARAPETSWCQGRWAARPERAPCPRQPAARTCLGVGEGSPPGAAGTPARGFLAPVLPGKAEGPARHGGGEREAADRQSRRPPGLTPAPGRPPRRCSPPAATCAMNTRTSLCQETVTMAGLGWPCRQMPPGGPRALR